MENIINSIKTLFTAYGFEAATIILLTLLLVNLLKKPIVARAEKTALRTGCDKSVVTRYVSLLPIAVALLLTFLWTAYKHDFRVAELDYGTIVSSSVMYAGLAVATYETAKKQLQAFAAKSAQKTSAPRPLAGPSEESAAVSEPTASASARAAQQEPTPASETRDVL